MRFRAQSLVYCFSEARLANARLTRDQHYTSVASLGLRPPTHQKIDLLVSTDERSCPCAQCLEATLYSAWPQNGPGVQWLNNTFEVLCSEVLQLKEVA